MVYSLRSRPITHSTWMRTLAIPLVRSTSTGSSCDFPLVNAWILNFACLSPTLSEIVKPLSAMTISPGTKNSKKPQFSVRYLSEVLPPQASDTKEMFLRVSIYDSRGSTMAVNDGCQGLRSRGGKPRIGLPSGFSTKLSHVQWEIPQTRNRGATFFPPCRTWRICRIS